jgi:fibronectin-binding autotransporter adhesin
MRQPHLGGRMGMNLRKGLRVSTALTAVLLSGTAYAANTTYSGNSSANNDTITNNSGDFTTFRDTSQGGTATITNNTGGETDFINSSTAQNATISNLGGLTLFSNSSNAGSATITNGTAGLTRFFSGTTAQNATIINNSGGTTRFEGNSNAGSARITNNAGTLIFFDTSTAGNATISNATGSTTFFVNATTAANAAITNNGGNTEFDNTSVAASASITNLNNGRVTFFNTSNAGNATITNNNTGLTLIRGTSSGGNATITSNSGGRTLFADSGSGGNARLIANGTGLVDFSNGPATNTAGSLEGSGQFFLGGVTLTVGSNNLSTGVSGTIQDGGSGGGTGASLVKVGTGKLTLSGNNTYTGGTTVQAGTLSVNGTLAGTLQVLNGGVLAGTGTIGNTTIASGGMIAPGNSVGTLHVNGNITLAAGSVYDVEIASTGASDLIAATGVATLQGGSVSVAELDAATNYQTGQTYRILTAQGGVSGTFNPSVMTNSAFLDATLTNTPNAVDLTIAVKQMSGGGGGSTGPFPIAAITKNQIATAGALNTLQQSGASQALYNKLLVLDAASARTAFDALSGEIYASATTALVEDSRFIRDAATNRIRAAFDGVAASSIPVMAYGEGGPQSTAALSEQFSIWGTGFGSWGSTDSNGNAASLDRSTGGFLIGADAIVVDNWRLGLLAGYSHTSFSVDDRNSSGDSDNYHLGVYGGSQWGNLGFRAGAAYSWHNIGTSRSVVFPGFTNNLSADYDAATAQVFGEFGYRIDTNRVAFEPFANLAYVNFRNDSFNESGGAAALAGSKTTTDTTFTTLGLRASTDFVLGGMTSTARGMLGWRHAFGDTTPESNLAFTGSNAFVISGAPIAEDALALEAGLDFKLSSRATLGISYNGQLASKARDNAFKADISLKF